MSYPLLPILLFFVVASYLPSFRVSYFGEDVLLHLPEAASPFHLSQLWKLHAEHFIPLVKLMYRFCYHFFWLDPVPFHCILTLVLGLCVLILYKLLYQLTHSRAASLFGSALFGFSTLYDSAVVEMCNAQTLFCLLFSLSLLYCIGEYFKTRRNKWRFFGIVNGFLATCTFAFGVLMGLWGILYFYFCISDKQKSSFKRNILDLSCILSGWFVGAILYLLHVKNVIFLVSTLQTQVVNKAFQFYSLKMGLMALKNIWNPLITHIYLFHSISLLLFFGFICALFLNYDRSINRKVIFFLFWIVGHYFLIGAARHITEIIYIGSRHNLFPVAGLACIYAVMFTSVPLINTFKIRPSRVLVYSLVVLIFIFSFQSKKQSIKVHYPQGILWTSFYKNFKASVSDYLTIQSVDKIKIEDGLVLFDSIFIIPESLSQLSQFILPGTLRDKIEWGKRTDERFFTYIKNNRSKYPVFFNTLAGQQYFPIERDSGY